MQRDYHVHLDAFEGPLDLLLFLIRRAEVEITDIPIAVIADQYVAYLNDLETIDIDTAGEFLVMAATLTEIKARMLSPDARATDGDPAAAGGTKAADPRDELVRQLLNYKKYRDAAGELDRRRIEWENRFPAGRAAIEDSALADAVSAEASVDVEDVCLSDLVDAFARIMATVDLNRIGEHHVVMDDTPIELHAEDIIDRLGREQTGEGNSAGVPFRSLFEGRTRSEMIGLFLAMLELVRQRRVRVLQDHGFGEISMALMPDEPAADAPVGDAGDRPAESLGS